MRATRFFFTVVLISLLCCFLLSTHANAQETQNPKPWRLGVHLVSLHKPGRGMNTITPGVYALHSSGATLGAYRNSKGHFSAYVGWTYERGALSVTLGAVTGYQRAKVLPMVVPSYAWGNGYRVSLIPNPFGQSAIHFSKEFN